MKILVSILAVIALLVLLGGALNHETQVSLDYLVGSTPGVSIFWFALGVGAGLLIAGLAGWSVGRAGAGDTRAKLERELESTYRRLRECEAKVPAPVAPDADATPAALAPADEAVTVAAPAPHEAVTAVAPAATDETDTIAAPAAAEEGATVATPAPAADEAETAAAAAEEGVTAVTPAPSAPTEADADDPSAS